MKERILAFVLMTVICFSTMLTSCDFVLDLFEQEEESENGNDTPDGGEEDGGAGDGDPGLNPDPERYEAELAAINVPVRFKEAYTIDRAKLEGAAAAATEKLKAFGTKHGMGFVTTSSTDYKYGESKNNNWVCGMYTGSYLMAYQITGDNWFKDVVTEHIDSFVEREANRVGMDDHDVGFAFVPSCVGAYKVLGLESAKAAAQRAVAYYYSTGYSQEGRFIIRSHKWNALGGYRTMIDSLMNASLFLWAGKEFDREEYTMAGYQHNLTSVRLIVRDDGSTYHHYQFDPETSKPLYGLTWQGLSDESCWSRGQSWGVYGFSIAYSYASDSIIRNAQRDVTYYMLNHLPDDLIPYWDYTFTSGDEPRDSSAAAIAVCGMLDMASMLPEGSAQRTVYESAAAQIMEALIDKCTTDIGVEYDGLIHSVTHGKPQNLAIEECAPYADYFYLEALARFLKQDFIRPW
ncbi:MAG: glycoside hydrolase family 88 protein [Clostridia bacterium]|nr:glycoside hydrolase family 88 protein [Clostridia bacterium]